VQTRVCPDRDVRTRLPAARADLAGVLGRQGAYQQLRHPLAALPQAWNRAPLAYGSAVARRGCGSRWRTARSSRAIRSPDETSACACVRLWASERLALRLELEVRLGQDAPRRVPCAR